MSSEVSKSILHAISLFILSATATTAEPLETFRDCNICPQMIELPVGNFLMGPLLSGNGSWSDSTDDLLQPPQMVTVDIPIAASQNEVTFAEFYACVNDGGCTHRPNNEVLASGSKEEISRAITDPRFRDIPFERIIFDAEQNGGRMTLPTESPVIDINYFDALEYVRWLNRKLQTDAYRLPTEAEWEYAARGGTLTPYAQGTEATADQINASAAQTERILGQLQPQLRTLGYPVPVNEMDAANAWGLRHMSGNVAEFTQSCFEVDPERAQLWPMTSEWLTKTSGPNCIPVIRGGSYVEPIQHSEVTWRRPRIADTRSMNVGFRVFKELE